MNLFGNSAVKQAITKPRTRGDEPLRPLRALIDRLKTPHTRG